jgi:hypothetical protein
MAEPTQEQIKRAQEAGNAAYLRAFSTGRMDCYDAYRAAYDDTLAALIAAADDNPLAGVDWNRIKSELSAERAAQIEIDMQAAAAEAGVTEEWTPARTPTDAEFERMSAGLPDGIVEHYSSATEGHG